MRHTIPLAIVGISLLVAACDKKPKDDESQPAATTEAVQKETAGSSETWKSYATRKHDEYREKADALLKSYEKRFNELKPKIDKASDAAKRKYHEVDKAWQEKAKTVREQLDKFKEEFKTASLKALEEMEKKIDAGMEELRKLYEKARSAAA
jgi:DNA anti-recombination protein RmuC